MGSQAAGSGVRLAELMAALSIPTDLGMGQPLESAVENISKVIHAEKLNVEDPQRGIKMELGRTVSVGLVWMFYMPWMWISLGFIKAGASLVLASTGDGGRRR